MNPILKPKDIPENWAPEVGDLINQLICRKEDQRLGKTGAKVVKSHPWFSDINWDEIASKKISPPFIPRNVSLDNILYYFTL